MFHERINLNIPYFWASRARLKIDSLAVCYAWLLQNLKISFGVNIKKFYHSFKNKLK
jgi:hypothetical protein